MASFNVIANEERCTRAGDSRRYHRCDGEVHDGTNAGVHDVFINNMSAQAKDDPVSCGCTQAMGSDNVFVN